MEFDLEGLDTERERWLDLGGVEVLIRYQTPLDAEKFRRDCLRTGIMKTGRSGVPEIQEGRESDYAIAFCRRYVHGWKGNIKPPDAAYSPEQMARVMLRRRPVYEALHAAVGEDESFFANGSRPPTGS